MQTRVNLSVNTDFRRSPLAWAAALGSIVFLLAAGGAAASENSDVEQLVAQANAAYRVHRYATVVSLADQAARVDPDSGEALLLGGLARYELGNKSEARGQIALALEHGLASDDRELAQTYLDLIELDSQADHSWSYYLRAALGGGFDSNVRLSPQAEQAGATDSDTGARGGGFMSASLFLGGGRQWGPFSTELEYGFRQTAFPDRTLDGSSFQVHMLEWMNELWIEQWARVRLPLRADTSLVGLAGGLESFEWSYGAEPEVAFVLGPTMKLRLLGGVTHYRPVDPAVPFLAGTRFQGSAALEVSQGGWMAAFVARYRDEELGHSLSSATDSDPLCATCKAEFVTPFSYRAPIFGARVSAPSSWIVRPSVNVAVEDRRYEPSFTGVTLADGSRAVSSRPVRHDVRTTASASLTMALSAVWQLSVRYDILVNVSNLKGSGCETPGLCHPLQSKNYNYSKNTIGLEIEADWM